MKTLIEKWSHSQEHSFIIKQYPVTKQPTDPQEVLMRLHDEYEVTIITGCSGKRFIGNTIENFSKEELFLIGPQVPHSIQLDDGEEGDVITIHFLENAFGQGFFDLPENDSISRLLQEAQLGVGFNTKVAKHFHKKLARLFSLKPFERMIAFIKILQQLSLAQERRVLSSHGFTPINNHKDYVIVNKTYEYIINRFEDHQITLDEISSYVNMSPATFCRYFKKHFHKTFTGFLNEVRIGHACKCLQETNKNIAEIAFASGYNQLTHFNRQFKRIMGYSPKAYRKALNGDVVR